MAEVVIVRDAATVGGIVADEIARLIRSNPETVLGLATGSTPLPVYDALPARLEGVDVTRVRGFALDEYVASIPRTPKATGRSSRAMSWSRSVSIPRASAFRTVRSQASSTRGSGFVVRLAHARQDSHRPDACRQRALLRFGRRRSAATRSRTSPPGRASSGAGGSAPRQREQELHTERGERESGCLGPGDPAQLLDLSLR